ncbi:MAG: pimeloyl-ACP methyl ester esterase BioH [Gammaproteobacteria bacterium]|nr:pimeloyl-ACP methyl ester esterase BioH [Gammaproteobacteria bacterium]MCF6230012.1 pimeloyl-ACP methyl ester esterase BioH [Gammaproteobacteria bacterium]
MNLHIQSEGLGPPLVFLHGWGMNSDVWEDISPQLSQHYAVTLIDLPGHGRSTLTQHSYQLEQLAEELIEVIPQAAILVGWSLGGLIALQIAHQYPEQIQAVVMVASSPRFVQASNWPYGVDAAIFDKFARDLKDDYQATLKRFIAIQAMGSAHAKSEICTLRERILRHGNPHHKALQGGLRLLQQSDLRQSLAELHCPIKLILGSRDTLAPARIAGLLSQQHPHLESSIIQGAAHAPFISHPGEFLVVLKEFINHHV